MAYVQHGVGVGLGELAGGKGADLSLEHGAVVPARVYISIPTKSRVKMEYMLKGQALVVCAHGVWLSKQGGQSRP